MHIFTAKPIWILIHKSHSYLIITLYTGSVSCCIVLPQEVLICSAPCILLEGANSPTSTRRSFKSLNKRFNSWKSWNFRIIYNLLDTQRTILVHQQVKRASLPLHSKGQVLYPNKFWWLHSRNGNINLHATHSETVEMLLIFVVYITNEPFLRM